MQSLTPDPEEDIWTSHVSDARPHADRTDGVAGVDRAQGLRPALAVTEHVIPPLGDQSNLPFWERKWIAPELAELLFAQPAEGPVLRTYLVIDAGLRQAVRGVHDLDPDAIELPVRCLFQGAAADELEMQAPYLIDMTLTKPVRNGEAPPPKFVRDFFVEDFNQKTGIFLRTAASMDVVWKHLRRFTRLRMEHSEKWYFYRYWDPVGATVPLFEFLAERPEQAAAWFQSDADRPIASYIYQDYRDDTVRVAQFDPAALPSQRARFDTFTQAQRAHGVRYLIKRRCYDIAKHLQLKFPKELGPRSTAEIEAHLLRCSDRMQRYGMRQQEFLMQIFVWDLLIGEEFEHMPTHAAVLEALQGRKREPMKFDTVRNLMRAHAPHLELADE